MSSVWKAVTGAALAGAVLVGTVGDASATTARKLYNRGHGYGYYGGGYHHHRYYGGNPGVGAAVAGTALGIVGLAAGAAAANRYDYDPGYYGPGYAPGYYAPGYAPGYDYDPF